MQDFIIDCDKCQSSWIKKAISYLPDEVRSSESRNIAIVSLGEIGACRLPPHYRQREIVFLSDWIFPSTTNLESDPPGQAFIFTILHEIAHAVLRHKSPSYDSLTPEQNRLQEEEANNLAIEWFNSHVESKKNAQLLIDINNVYAYIDSYRKVHEQFRVAKSEWYKEF